jgi:ammonium transporter, Amt family
MLAVGAVAERGRIGPLMIFVFLWSTLVYDFIAHWIWNPNGWSSRLGGLDFAGGTPVHISSGVTALAISIHIGPRLGFGTPGFRYPANNVSYVALGTVLMWFGWFGFNGGSALSANLKAANAIIVSNVAASSGALTYALCVRLDYYRRLSCH